MSQPDIQCLHNRRVQMLTHPCFTLEQFIKDIRLVQCVPPSSPQPFGWPHRPEGEECVLHTQSGSHRDVMDSQDVNPTDVDTSIEDIWIGATNDILPGSQPKYQSNEVEELEAANASAETLINIDPASRFKCLDILYIELGYKAGVPEHNSLQKRFLAVLQRIDTEGWDVMSPELEDVGAFMHNLHKRVTLLSEAVQLCAPGIGHNGLLQQCKKLLCLTRRRLAAERELITLIERSGTEAYDEIILAGLLSWKMPSE
ncbi:uncharacterized protein F5891DRAFT_1195212 [Suillus fuscotomentosus]|uniref:Uncharacterized protein n=1 Tax=Suillus fuscotomentosus TaxID=1912939 RepID=A0AAD4DXN5_9AGAM|nr:uncharacterized protein F5891DRAFT_1195212 [Suillus fuscotomentosus]KAG1894513.1 hypothetical protein F5891DRAFT_1195212 [Suillus fuscotomentosus]